MPTQYRLSPFTTVVHEGATFTLVFWGSPGQPQVYLIDDPCHPMYRIVAEVDVPFAPFESQYSEDFNSLLDEEIIVPENWERQAAIERYLNAVNHPSGLNLILSPAGTRCNCECTYCGQDHDGKAMTWDHEGVALLKFIRNRAPKHLCIDFFGGEPLCATPFVLRFCDEISKICYETGMEFSGSMTTNATLLTIDLFHKLLDRGVCEFQITLDGTEEHHNRLRPLRNGDNSYRMIMANILNIRSLPTDYSIILRTNFDNHSCKQEVVASYLQEIKELIGDDSRFTLRFRPAYDWGGDIDTQNLCSKMRSSEATSQCDQMAAAMGFRLADLHLWGAGGHVCYAGKQNSFFIEPGLKVKKCTVSEEEFNHVGIISESGMFVANSNWNLWVSKSETAENCGICLWQPTCLGVGCKLMMISKVSDSCLKNSKLLKDVASLFIM